MKKNSKITFVLIIILYLFFPSGYQSSKAKFSGGYYPVFMKRSELEKSIAWMPAHSLINPGKIYVQGNLIFINEKFKGVHVLDNTNPKNPVNLGFIRIPGNLDIAVKNNTLYADNAVDLTAIDISVLNQTHVTFRQKNAFPEPYSPDGYSGSYYGDRPANAVIVEWRKAEGK